MTKITSKQLKKDKTKEEFFKNCTDYTQDEIKTIIAKFLRLTYEDLSSIMFSPDKHGKLTVFEALILSIIHKSFKNGDFSKVDFLLNRAGLKIKDTLEIHSTHDSVFGEFDKENVIKLLRKVNSEKEKQIKLEIGKDAIN